MMRQSEAKAVALPREQEAQNVEEQKQEETAGAVSEPVTVRLRRLRGSLGLTQREFAAQAGVSEDVVANAETYTNHRPAIKNRQRIAKALGVDEDALWPSGASQVLSPDLSTVGGRIRAARHARGMNKYAASRALGVGSTWIQRREHDGVAVAGDLERLANALQCSVEWLRTGEGEAPTSGEEPAPAPAEAFPAPPPTRGEPVAPAVPKAALVVPDGPLAGLFQRLGARYEAECQQADREASVLFGAVADLESLLETGTDLLREAIDAFRLVRRQSVVASLERRFGAEFVEADETRACEGVLASAQELVAAVGNWHAALPALFAQSPSPAVVAPCPVEPLRDVSASWDAVPIYAPAPFPPAVLSSPDPGNGVAREATDREEPAGPLPPALPISAQHSQTRPLLLVGGHRNDATLRTLREQYGVVAEWEPMQDSEKRARGAVADRLRHGKHMALVLTTFLSHGAHAELAKSARQGQTPVLFGGRGGIGKVVSALAGYEAEHAAMREGA